MKVLQGSAMNANDQPSAAFWPMIVGAMFAGATFGVSILTLAVLISAGVFVVLLPIFIVAAWLVALLMMPVVGPVAGILPRPFYRRGIKSYALYIRLGTLVGGLSTPHSARSLLAMR